MSQLEKTFLITESQLLAIQLIAGKIPDGMKLALNGIDFDAKLFHLQNNTVEHCGIINKILDTIRKCPTS